MIEENMRGVQMNLLDVAMHTNHVLRTSGQFLLLARRAYYAAELAAEPIIQEPILAEILFLLALWAVSTNTSTRERSIIVEEIPILGTSLSKVQVFSLSKSSL